MKCGWGNSALAKGKDSRGEEGSDENYEGDTEIIFEEGRFLLISSPEDEATFEAPLAPDSAAGVGAGVNPNGYSSCDDQEGSSIVARPPTQMDLTYKQAIRTKEFLLVNLINSNQKGNYKINFNLICCRCG